MTGTPRTAAKSEGPTLRSSAERPAVSVIIPAYNEEESLREVIRGVRNTLSQLTNRFEILVVDDGSTDATADRAQATGARLLQHDANRGYGAALKTGIRHARESWICIADADGTYPTERIPELLGQAVKEECDMVVGARTGRDVAIPTIRRPGKWIIGKLANLVAGAKIPDVNSGLRVFRRDAALRFFNLLPDGFSFTTTLTLAMLSNGYLVHHVPIDYYHRVGQSKIRPVRDTLNFLQLILRIALYFGPLKVFLPVSLILFLAAVGWGLFSLLVLERLADVSTLVILMAAVQVAALGLLAELINRRLPNLYREDRP